MLALLAAIIMSVPLDTSDYSVSVTAPQNFVEDFSIDTGSSLTTIGGDYLEIMVQRFQAVRYKDVILESVSGQEFRVPTYLLPHFRIGDCDLGTIQAVEGPKEVPNLLGMNVLTRVEHWSFNSDTKSFQFTCPTQEPIVQFWR